MGAIVTLVDVKDRPILFGSSAVAAITAADRSLGVSVTAQTAMVANTARKGWKIKNDTDTDVWFRFGGTATAIAGGGNAKVAAGGYMSSEPLPNVETGAMSIIHGGTGTKNISIVEFT